MGVLTCCFFCCKPEDYLNTLSQDLPVYHNRKSPKFVVWTIFSVYKGWSTQYIPLRSFNVKKTNKQTNKQTKHWFQFQMLSNLNKRLTMTFGVSSSSFVTQSFIVKDTNSKCLNFMWTFNIEFYINTLFSSWNTVNLMNILLFLKNMKVGCPHPPL